MKNLHRYFHYFAGIVFLAVIFIAIFGQDVNKGLAVGDVNDIRNFSDFPLDQQPTAIPPGNNVPSPINTGSTPQTKAGPLSASSLSAGSISSGPITAGTISASSINTSGNSNVKALSTENLSISGSAVIQGDLILGDTLDFNGYRLRIEFMNGGEDSYGAEWICNDAGHDTCNGDFNNSYACASSEQRTCTDVIYGPECICREGNTSNSFYNGNRCAGEAFAFKSRQVSCVSRRDLIIAPL